MSNDKEQRANTPANETELAEDQLENVAGGIRVNTQGSMQQANPLEENEAQKGDRGAKDRMKDFDLGG